MKKVLVGVCTGGVIQAQTVGSLVGALDKLKAEGYSYKLAIRIGGNKSRNMNKLVEETLDGGYDYLMSIDADMVFPTDGVVRLIDNDKDIVGANYSVRGNGVGNDPREVVVKMADEDGNLISMAATDLPKELFRCHGLGNGFTLYKREVFKDMARPWFEDFEDENGKWSGEDINFHRRAYQAGFEVWCNPKIKMGHIGTYNYVFNG